MCKVRRDDRLTALVEVAMAVVDMVVVALAVVVSVQEEEALVVVDLVQGEAVLDQAVEEDLEARAVVVVTVTVEVASAEEALDRAMV